MTYVCSPLSCLLALNFYFFSFFIESGVSHLQDKNPIWLYYHTAPMILHTVTKCCQHTHKEFALQLPYIPRPVYLSLVSIHRNEKGNLCLIFIQSLVREIKRSTNPSQSLIFAFSLGGYHNNTKFLIINRERFKIHIHSHHSHLFIHLWCYHQW